MSSKDEDTKPTVPKFASFKPKSETSDLKAPKFSSFKPKDKEKDKKSPTSFNAKDEGRERERERDSRRKRSHHHSDSRRDHHRSKRHRTNSRDRHREKPRTGHSEALEHRPLTKVTRNSDDASRLYIIDTKGDPLIIRYGSLDRSQVPGYYRDGYGKVLGTRGRLVIHRDGPRDQFSLRMPGEGSYALKDKDGLRSKNWRVRHTPLRVRKQEINGEDEEDGDFLALSSSKKRKHSHQASDSSDDEEQPTYRSIEGKAKPRQYDDSDVESESDVAADDINLDQNNPLKWKSIQLSRRVKDQPDDIDAWLELSNHQDALLRAGEDVDHKALEAEVHSFAEIKLHMLESALSNVSNHQDRIRVLIPLMKEGIKVWNSKVAAKKWLDLREDEDKNFALWKTHLDFSMFNISAFHFDTLKQMHLDRIRHVMSRSHVNIEPEDLKEAIYVFLRLTRFIHDSGYKELAVAAWQAFLELNFFRPTQLDDQSAAFESLRDFWESEVPRIGEADAQGWAKFVADGGIGDAPEPLQDIKEPRYQSRDDYKRWASLESSQADKARVPARTMDEGTEDDPFRVVMFSDIEPLLFFVPKSILPAVQEQLLDAFLIFQGLPPTFWSDHWTEEAYHDQFLAFSTLHTESSAPTPLSGDEDPTEIQRKPPSFRQNPLCVSETLDVLFPQSEWFSYLPSRNRKNDVELGFMVNATKQLVHNANFGGLATYHLALSQVQDGSSVKKAARALLKRYPTDLSLYRAYAIAEYANENHEVASKVVSSATELASVSNLSSPILTRRHADQFLQESPTADAFALWRAWSWMELQGGDKQLAVRRLCSYVDDALRRSAGTPEVSSTHILKAHQTFSSLMSDFISGAKLEGASTLAECLVLLSYLTSESCAEPMSASQGSISAAIETVHRVSLEFKSRGYQASRAHERLLQFASRLLYLHATRG
jgi:hypothetical protein